MCELSERTAIAMVCYSNDRTVCDMMIDRKEEEEEERRGAPKIPCYFVCDTLADRVVRVTDSFGDYIADFYLCQKCHEMFERNSRQTFKWKLLEQDDNADKQQDSQRS